MRKFTARTVVPYSGVKETGVNVPSLQLFLPFSEGAGNTTTCPKTGATWDIASNSEVAGGELSWTAAGAAISSLSSEEAPSLISGCPAITISAGKSYLAMASAKITGDDSCRAAMGDINSLVTGSNGVGFGMSDGSPFSGTGVFHAAVGISGSNRAIDVDAGTDLSSAQSGADAVVFAKYVAETSLAYQASNFDTAATLLAADTYTATEDPVPYTLDPYFRFSGFELYGYALFEFSAFPAWIDTAIYWMAHQWRHAGLGKPRYIYPQLIGYV